MGDQMKKVMLTSKEQYDMDVVAETELSRLQRQFRIMEGDRSAFTGATTKGYGRQERMINIWTNEHINIMQDLEVSTSPVSKKQDHKMVHCLKEQLEINSTYTEEIAREKKYLKELNYQINRVEKQIDQTRKLEITDCEYQTALIHAENKVRTLENSLDTNVKRFCKILTKNRQMREEIDHLLKERVQFNKLWEKLICTLNVGKKYMLDLIEQATIAYSQRNEWCMKLQALRMRSHSEYVLDCEEMRELQRKFDHDQKLQKFLLLKNQVRVLKQLNEKEARRRRLAREELEKKIQVYRKTLIEVTQVCQENDLKRIADNYLKREEENFALFKYITALNNELEMLTDSIGHLRLNIDEQIELKQIRIEQQNNNLTVLNKKLEEETEATELAKINMLKNDKFVQEMFVSLRGLFNKIKCDNAPILKLLGENTQINKYNVMLYMRLMDDNVTNLIAQTYYHEKHDKVPRKLRQLNDMLTIEDAEILSVSELVPHNPCPLCIENEFVTDLITVRQMPMNKQQVELSLAMFKKKHEKKSWVHSLSECCMPAARKLLQKKYNR